MAELSQAAQLHDGPGYIAGQVHQILGYAMISPLHSPHPAPPACAIYDPPPHPNPHPPTRAN